MTARKWLVDKIVFSLVVLAAFYAIGSTWGVVPEPMKDGVNWLGENFQTIAWAGCVLVVCYVVLRIVNRQKAKPGSK